MDAVKTSPAHRSARERRDNVLDAAVAEFAVGGLHGTSTEAIAARAGISQPYVFRLFGSKKGLFLAAVERGFDRVESIFRQVAEQGGDDLLPRMGKAYVALLAQREELLLQLQAYAACADSDVTAVAQRRYGALYRYVEQVSGASEQEVRTFFAHGMLLTVAAAIKLPDLVQTEGWAMRCLDYDR